MNGLVADSCRQIDGTGVFMRSADIDKKEKENHQFFPLKPKHACMHAKKQGGTFGTQKNLFCATCSSQRSGHKQMRTFESAYQASTDLFHRTWTASSVKLLHFSYINQLKKGTVRRGHMQI